MTEKTEIFAGLTKEQIKAIVALINNRTIREASQESGVSEASLYRWLKQEDFRESYRKARSELIGQAVTLLQKGCTEAYKTLEAIHKDKESPATARVTAARTVLETAFKTYEQDEIIQRLERLERYLEKDLNK
ncbi:MAG: hypothetical protein CVU89_03420 [Firmicutes bacterium HGW-Firmicutes-14]|nr:MAG: hypothetical protein CVU89_03420 [Firmicutes bacterium HGW-Firmicutes-14]